jgi:signal transduction histidine kinase
MSQQSASAFSPYQRYGRQIRMRLASVLSTILVIAGALYFLAFNLLLLSVPVARQPVLFAVDGIVVVVIGLFALAGVAARQKQEDLAAVLLISALTLGITTLAVSFALGHVLDPLLLTAVGAYPVVIVLASVLGRPRLLIATTIALNIGSLLLILLDAGKTADLSFSNHILRELPLLAPQVIIIQWAVATILLITSSLFRNTLGQLSETEVAMRRSQQVEQLKDQFITNVNHELRTPIMAVHGFLEIYTLRPDLPAERRERLIQRAFTASRDVIDLLNSVLDIQRLEPHMADYQPQIVDLQACLEKVRSLLDPRLGYDDGRELRIAIPDGFVLWGDPVWLQQILLNLLENAGKYSERGFPVEIAARVVETTPGERSRPGAQPVASQCMAEITVRDWGFGIPPDQIPLLFQRFVRLPRDLASPIIGNGLGLFLCRRFAEAMGGDIWVESDGREGEGSTFFIHLPLPPASAEREAREGGV